jgi:prepilin-type processing-associated H-X9-DG protein
MSGTSVKGPYPCAKIALAGIVFLILAAWVFPSVILTLMHPPERIARRVVCMSHLKMLGVSLVLYANEHSGQYPAAERWCDLLADGYVKAETFRCPTTKTESCDYALNPHAEPNDARDVVLLLESQPGWNQRGGSELLTTENHDGKGCNVLFVDGHVEFVKAEKLAGLKWVDEETFAPVAPNGQRPVNDEE